MNTNLVNPRLDSPIMSTIAMVSDKWKVLIICKLRENTLRFNELRRELQGVTQRVLTHQLRELEADGLVTRKVFAEVPPRVEYSLTELGRTLIPVLQQLEEWAHEHSEELASARSKKESARLLQARAIEAKISLTESMPQAQAVGL
ncbi:MAG: helix-turn-helix domain-containing protein [Candidatus Obscuribacterales bacterium]|nr:helix-turn-helix domain-containing protein [Candidatus Obscuribacterales bacterium]